MAHWIPGPGGTVAGPGYEGKGFLAEGFDVAMNTYAVEVRRLMGSYRPRGNFPAKLVASRRTRDVTKNAKGVTSTFELYSNIDSARLFRFKLDVLELVAKAMHTAGLAGRSAAIKAYEQSTPRRKTGERWSSRENDLHRVGQGGDNQDIATNIGFRVVVNQNEIGLVIGAKKPSVKMWAQEHGLDP